MRRPHFLSLVVCWVLVGGVAGALIAQSPPAPGDPLPGLTPVEFELFAMGQDDFLEVQEAEEGLALEAAGWMVGRGREERCIVTNSNAYVNFKFFYVPFMFLLLYFNYRV